MIPEMILQDVMSRLLTNEPQATWALKTEVKRDEEDPQIHDRCYSSVHSDAYEEVIDAGDDSPSKR